MAELKSFTSCSDGAVAIGTEFTVDYVVSGGAGTIAVSCKAPYSVAPATIPVTRKAGTASITISGPAGDAKVVVYGRLVRTRQFTQQVK